MPVKGPLQRHPEDSLASSLNYLSAATMSAALVSDLSDLLFQSYHQKGTTEPTLFPTICLESDAGHGLQGAQDIVSHARPRAAKTKYLAGHAEISGIWRKAPPKACGASMRLNVVSPFFWRPGCMQYLPEPKAQLREPYIPDLVAQQPCYNEGALFWVGHFIRKARKQKKGQGHHWAIKLNIPEPLGEKQGRRPFSEFGTGVDGLGCSATDCGGCRHTFCIPEP